MNDNKPTPPSVILSAEARKQVTEALRRANTYIASATSGTSGYVDDALALLASLPEAPAVEATDDVLCWAVMRKGQEYAEQLYSLEGNARYYVATHGEEFYVLPLVPQVQGEVSDARRLDGVPCWLVEKRKDSRTVGYLGYALGTFEWFPTPDQATRFVRREDANGVAECFEFEDVILAEHIWG